MMKNYKRILAVLCVLTLLMQLMILPSYAERVTTDEDVITQTDSETVELISAVHHKEFSILYTLGIIKGDAEVKRQVSRGEFAEILYAIKKLYAEGALGFRDVDPDSDIAEAINAVTEYGYMGGYGDGTFRPNEPVKYEETVYALLGMAGYGEMVSLRGGDPNGYVALAGEKNLVLESENASGVTYGDMVVILYNYLKTNVVKVSIQGQEKKVYESEATVMEEFLGLYEGKGIVYANEHIGIKGRKKTPEGMAIVEYDNKESMIEIGNSGIDDYVGYYVRYYFNEDDKIIFCEPDEKKNVELEITEENFNEIDKKLSLLEYRREDGKSKDAKISSTADFVYNGTSCYEITVDDFEKADYIRLIDNDSDGEFDVVYLSVYSSYMVGNVSYKEKIIQDQRENIYYSFQEDKWNITYEKNGMKTDINIIKEWDILNIEESKDIDKKLVRVNISSDIISGIVESLDVSERRMTIGDEEYYISKKIDINTVIANSDVVIGLNEFGAVVCIKQMKREREYAYLTNILRDDSNDEISVKVFNQSAKVEKIAFAEKFYINNKKGTWESLVPYIEDYNSSSGGYGRFTARGQLIAYRVNSEGKIDRLYTAGEAKGAVEESYSGELVLNKKFTNLRIRTQFPTINSEYIYEKNTPIFIIVRDSSTNEVIEELCTVKTKATLNITESSRPGISVYDAGKTRVAKAMVMEMKQAELTGFFDLATRQGFLVTKIRKVVNSDGEAVTEYVGITSGVETKYQQNEFYDFPDWKVGDLWVVTNDFNYKVINAKKLFEINSEEGSKTMNPNMDYSVNKSIRDLNSSSDTSDYTETHTGVYGTLTSVTKSDSMPVIRIRPEGRDEEVVYGINGTSIVIYRQDGTFEPIAFDNLSVGIGSGKIFCYTRYGFCRDIIIFE